MVLSFASFFRWRCAVLHFSERQTHLRQALQIHSSQTLQLSIQIYVVSCWQRVNIYVNYYKINLKTEFLLIKIAYSWFSPSGWDNESKVNILLENLTTIKAESTFSDIIAKPNVRKPLQRDVEPISATDDQEFLFKLQVHVNKVTSTANTRQVRNRKSSLI